LNERGIPGRWSDKVQREVAPGIFRRVLAGAHTMIVQYELKKDATLPLHTHPSEQITYVLSGALSLVVNGETFVVRAGETLVIPSGAEHGGSALEDTLEIDTFGPVRDDLRDEA
jgi:quercetin dioxygenase-like cupin family protein